MLRNIIAIDVLQHTNIMSCSITKAIETPGSVFHSFYPADNFNFSYDYLNTILNSSVSL